MWLVSLVLPGIVTLYIVSALLNNTGSTGETNKDIINNQQICKIHIEGKKSQNVNYHPNSNLVTFIT